MTRGLRQRREGENVLTGVLVSLVLTLVAIVAGTGPTPADAQSSSKVLPDILFVQAPQVAETNSVSRFPEGSRIVRLASGSPSSQPVNLTEGFFAVEDPAMSFDGSRVLFSAQKNSGETWQIWEMQADGTGKRQLTNCLTDCTRPGYLPGEEMAFTVASGEANGGFSYLAVARRDGTQVRRITFGPGDWRLETVLRDGRIVASGSWPIAASATSSTNRLLYTLRPDGSALDALRCEHEGNAVRGEATELEDGSIAFVKSSNTRLGSGALAEIEKGEVQERGLGTAGGGIQSLSELSAGRLVVSRKKSGEAENGGKFDLYVFDLKHKALGARIFSDARVNSLQPVPVLARSVPKKFWSTLNPEAKSGYFISLNSYASADEASGRISAAIASVRVWTLSPGTQQEEIAGEAPVEKDGSFYVEVKADQPVRFELLDARGKRIRAERSWIWSRGGEQRGCAGCHSDKAVAPENRWPMTLKRFDTPTAVNVKQGESEVAHAN
jgi:hypothetical protein